MNVSTFIDKIAFSNTLIFNIFSELFFVICCLSVFISLFELYYKSKCYIKKDIKKSHL